MSPFQFAQSIRRAMRHRPDMCPTRHAREPINGESRTTA
jgi:hypothetical protein